MFMTCGFKSHCSHQRGAELFCSALLFLLKKWVLPVFYILWIKQDAPPRTPRRVKKVEVKKV